MKPGNLKQLKEALSMVDVLGPRELNAFIAWVDGEDEAMSGLTVDEADNYGWDLLDWARDNPHV